MRVQRADGPGERQRQVQPTNSVNADRSAVSAPGLPRRISVAATTEPHTTSDMSKIQARVLKAKATDGTAGSCGRGLV
ncbi:hypothetical protein SGLAM104S_05601 [Streptomyces glaucescens]